MDDDRAEFWSPHVCLAGLACQYASCLLDRCFGTLWIDHLFHTHTDAYPLHLIFVISLTTQNLQSFESKQFLQEKVHQHSDPVSNHPPDVSQDGLQNNDPPTSSDSPQSQECCFTTIYPFQISVMSNLNRMDFKNLQLAGIRTPISKQLQRKYLIPTICHEKLERPCFNPVVCSNTTQTIDEIKACYGAHGDRLGLSMWSQPDKCIVPVRHFRHVRGLDRLVMAHSQNEVGNLDSFNICTHYHERDRQRRDANEDLTIRTFHKNLCKLDCLEYLEQQPYNTCRCKMFLERYWRCHTCAMTTLQELSIRAFRVLNYRDSSIRAACPILGCSGLPWVSGRSSQQIMMCCACTAIFPRTH